MKLKRSVQFLSLIASLAFFSGCATTPIPESSTHDLVTVAGGTDRIEGFNRCVFFVVDGAVHYLIRPVGSIYSSIIPRPVVNSINHFTDNLGFVPRCFSCFLQGRPGDGGVEFVRFLINTTAGVGGFFEVAEEWGWKRNDEDFGQAFASWGIMPGWPLYGAGPTNVRDVVGYVFDYGLDPKSYIYGGQAFTYLNNGLDAYPLYDQVCRDSFDPYFTLRESTLLLRYMKEKNWIPSLVPQNSAGTLRDTSKMKISKQSRITSLKWITEWQNPILDTLRISRFKVSDEAKSNWCYVSLFNSDFENSWKSGKVYVKKTENASKMPYRMWLQSEKPQSPLAVIIPGLGSHYSTGSATAMAQLLYNHGYSVVVVSHSMHWEFAETASDETFTGYTPTDARDMRRAIAKIVEQLKEEESIKPENIVITGYSAGGLLSLFIADLERKSPLLNASCYLAINPPVNPQYALSQIDNSFDVGNQWNEEQALHHVSNAFGYYLAISKMAPEDSMSLLLPYPQEDSTQPIQLTPMRLSVEDAEAQFLIGFSYRRTLRDLLANYHCRNLLSNIKNEYQWSCRQSLYQELNEFSYDKYQKEILVPYHSKGLDAPLSMEKMNHLAGLYAIEKTLKESPNVRIIHNLDDFLLTENDLLYLSQTLGNKIHFFDHGSHLGNLYLKSVQDSIIEFLESDIVK